MFGHSTNVWDQHFISPETWELGKICHKNRSPCWCFARGGKRQTDIRVDEAIENMRECAVEINVIIDFFEMAFFFDIEGD